MAPGSAAISETTDVTPQTLRDTTATVTPTSRGEAIQDSELLLLQSYTDYGAQRFNIVGENMVETVEALLIETMFAGSIVYRAAARNSLDAGTAGHRLSDASFAQVARLMEGLKCPEAPGVMGEGTGALIATMHPDVYYDLIVSGNMESILQYQDKAILLNKEVGYMAPFRIISSPWAKAFYGAGINHSTSEDTTLDGAVEALAKSLVLASGTNAASGEWLNVGSEETGTTFYPTNERVRHISGTTTSVIVGQADNGGLRYDHATGATVNNSDTVYPVIFGGPQTIAKVYASEVGEYGKTVGPEPQGLLDQWYSLGWKWYGGFGIVSQNWLARGEFASSLDA